LAKNEKFRQLLDIKNDYNPKVKKMEDVEIVLRFFALGFESNYTTYSNIGLESFLSNYMDTMNTRIKKEPMLLQKLEEDFVEVIDYIDANFDSNAFSKYNETRITKFNKAAFDALAISIYVEFDRVKNVRISDDFKTAHKDLFFNNDLFIKSINGATASTTKTQRRITTVRELLIEKF